MSHAEPDADLPRRDPRRTAARDPRTGPIPLDGPLTAELEHGREPAVDSQAQLVDTAKLDARRVVYYSLGGGGKRILGESVDHEIFVETTMSLMHPVDLPAARKVELRCVRSYGQVELSNVKLFAVPVSGLAIGPQPVLGLAKRGPESAVAKLKPKGRG